MFLAPTHESAADQPVQCCQRGVLAAIHRQHQSEPFAVFRQQADAGGQRGRHGTERQLPAADENPAPRGFVQTEDRLRDLRQAQVLGVVLVDVRLHELQDVPAGRARSPRLLEDALEEAFEPEAEVRLLVDRPHREQLVERGLAEDLEPVHGAVGQPPFADDVQREEDFRGEPGAEHFRRDTLELG